MQHGNGRDEPGRGDRAGGGPRGPEPTRRMDDQDATQVFRTTDGGAGGRVLGGRYRVEELIGRGGMADVHRGSDLRLDRPVAVKLFRVDTDRDSARRFTEEAHTLANLSHPGLVPVYDSGVEGDQPYLVMELVSGWTLREVIEEERLPLEEISRIGCALADVLGYVHQQGVVHRDIKPSNVLIGRDNRVRLADFGVAQPIDRSGPGFGTPAYLAPEQVREEWVGPPADVYSLGLVLLETVTGRVEYPGPDAAAARLSRSPEVPAELPSNMRRALLSMTDPDPKARPTASQAAGMLELEAAAPPPAAAVTRPEAGNTTNQIMVIALGAVLLAALIGFVALATNGDSSTAAAQSSTSATATRTPTTTRRTTETTTRTTEPTTRTTQSTTTRTSSKSPSSGISLPSVSDINLPDAPELSGSVTDGIKKAWQTFTDWLSGLF